MDYLERQVMELSVALALLQPRIDALEARLMQMNESFQRGYLPFNV
jgi:hypothetical protein